MKELTRAEEEVMQVLWDLESAFVRDIINQLSGPEPAYSTISTIVRILEEKGFVGHESVGRSHKYHPLVSKQEYTSSFMKGFVKKYFSGSYQQMVSSSLKRTILACKNWSNCLANLKTKSHE